MKKITLAITVVIMGFVMTSCGTKVSPTETILKAAQEFFDQAKAKLSAINNAEDFLAFVKNFNAEKEEFSQNLFADYMDEEGNVKGFTEEEIVNLQTKLSDIATEYNKEEANKAAEFIAPIIGRYENAVNALSEAIGNTDEETFDKLVEEYESAESELALFEDYDNVLPELQERAQAAENKLQGFLEDLLGL